MDNQRGVSASSGRAAVGGGLGATALGLLYATYAFGPTEAEVAMWGTVAFFAGLAIVIGAAGLQVARPGALRLGIALLTGAVALLQGPPILLWFIFHGAGISDGSPHTPFVAHWAYALPHVIVAALCVVAALGLARHPGVEGAPTPPGDLT